MCDYVFGMQRIINLNRIELAYPLVVDKRVSTLHCMHIHIYFVFLFRSNYKRIPTILFTVCMCMYMEKGTKTEKLCSWKRFFSWVYPIF